MSAARAFGAAMRHLITPTLLLSTIEMSSIVAIKPAGVGAFRGRHMATQTIRSEITGTVWKVVAAEGATVQEDEPIMILESMKMEIPVLAPETGRVIKLLV